MSEPFAMGAPSPRSDGAEGGQELLERMARDLTRASSAARYLALTWPVPRVPGERLLGAETEGDALCWAPPGDDEVSGLGAAFVLTASGPERFAEIERAANAVWPQLDASRCDLSAPPVRFFGGFAFQPGQAEGGSFEAFGDARFVVPKLSYLRNREGAWLRLIVPSNGWDRARFRGELEPFLSRALGALFSVPPPREPVRELDREEGSEESWGELIAAIKTEIASGRAQKIVAARRISLNVDRELGPDTVQSRFREHAPECTRFAFRVGGATFLGATPEQLVQKRGLELRTEAVAGSISADDATAAARLLSSSKDIGEHELVVREILRLLAPLTSELAPAPQREIHRLRTVLHLRTPIRGKLRAPGHVLSLVEKLHPTPAVGGVPTSAAIEFITAHEPVRRGWYTGPVGWFDAAGDGRFVVALRSGIVTGKHAELYAGAGVVHDSTAPSELSETRWKLAALLGALGISG